MTSTRHLRLWLVANPDGNRIAVAASDPQAIAAARTDSTVTQPLEQHLETVYRYALRLTGRSDLAEDITQETMLRGWRNRDKLREPRAARLWLLRITTNLWTDQLRKLKSQPRTLEVEPPCPSRLPADAHEEREHVRLAFATMDELPPRQRQVLYLITCEQLSHSEVASVLGIELTAVKSNLSLARKEMRLRLKDVYEAVCAWPAGEAIKRDI